jgi:type I restriction enzyme R subunit
MNKKELTEADIRTKFITAALTGALREKWNLMTQIREEAYFTKGRVIVRGKTVHRGEAKKADYILSYKPNLPIAVIEAKDNNHSVGADMQQALEYAEILDVPFAYSSNGDAFLEHDRTVTSGTVTRVNPARPVPFVRRTLGTLLQGQGLHGQSGIRRHAGLLRQRFEKIPALLPAHRDQPHRGC